MFSIKMTLKEFFKKRGQLQKMADALKVSRMHLYLISHGKRNASASLAIRIEAYTQGQVSKIGLALDGEALWGKDD